jgi:RNA polymerase sigma factor for flagellar operon FliA
MLAVQYQRDPRHDCILEHYSLVKTIALRLLRRLPDYIELEELTNIGIIGLIDAIGRFEPSKGVPFKSYAEIRIQGSMLDFLRKQDWVPRSVRRRSDQLETLRNGLQQKLGRKPHRLEIADAMNLNTESFDKFTRAALLQKQVSMDLPTGSNQSGCLGDFLKSDNIAADSLMEKQEMHRLIREAVVLLPEREQTVITMYYFQQKNLRQIGESLGVTESRACQLRGSGIRRLRRRVTAALC